MRKNRAEVDSDHGQSGPGHENQRDVRSPVSSSKVLDSYPEIVKGRLLVERPGDQDRMTLEIEVKGETSEEFLASVERTLRETVKLRGAVRVLASGALPPEHKTIDDVRKWD